MRKLTTILCLLAVSVLSSAQTRTYSDNESKTFIIGLESYFYGESGALEFKLGESAYKAQLTGGTVTVGGKVLEAGVGDTVIGVHDFTGNRNPELVIARRTPDAVLASVYSLKDGQWQLVGKVGAKDAKEIRVFRQVLSIRKGDALLSWTWHSGAFDFKSSDGSPEPVL